MALIMVGLREGRFPVESRSLSPGEDESRSGVTGVFMIPLVRNVVGIGLIMCMCLCMCLCLSLTVNENAHDLGSKHDDSVMKKRRACMLLKGRGAVEFMYKY